MVNPQPTLVLIDTDGPGTATPRLRAEADGQTLERPTVADLAEHVVSCERSPFGPLAGLPNGPGHRDDGRAEDGVEIGHPDVVDATLNPIDVGVGQKATDRVRTGAKGPHDDGRVNETPIEAADEPGVSADR